MGQKTKIDWCDSTWNPVTGCLHGCEYCYAQKIATRFNGFYGRDGNCHVLEKPIRDSFRDAITGKTVYGRVEPYPYEFDPTLHLYKLEEPQHWKKPRNIFVCSMADLFGDWVPDQWIMKVFTACQKAPQHRYLFLTKNPKRYIELHDKGILPVWGNWWFGTSTPTQDADYFFSDIHNAFVSIEPILGDFQGEGIQRINWAIIGAETGKRKNKVIPQRAWIDHVVKQCQAQGIPVFMKESLREMMGEDFRQEFPWEE